MTSGTTHPTLGGTLAQMVTGLMNRSIDRLDTYDLEQLTFERDDAQHIIEGLASLAENLASLLCKEEAEGREGLNTWAGGASSLLASIGLMARHADALLTMARLAEDELSKRMEDCKEQ